MDTLFHEVESCSALLTSKWGEGCEKCLNKIQITAENAVTLITREKTTATKLKNIFFVQRNT